MTTEYTLVIAVLFVIVIPMAMLLFMAFWLVQRKRAMRATAALSDASEKLNTAMEVGQTLLQEKGALTSRVTEIEARFKDVLDLDAEAASLRAQNQHEASRIEQLRASYAEKKIVYDRLLKEVAIFDEKLAFAEMGVYEPHFDYTDSEEYKQNVEAVRAAQKQMVSLKTAVVCPTAWTVDGSTAKGQTMTNRNIKLTLRAFNNECDAAIANTRWNNVNAMEKRMGNALIQINKLNESNRVFITEEYVKLKFQELFLTHEYREKLKAEREERAELARAQKEEQKLIRDMERAEEDEARYQRLLDKAKTEAERAVGPKLEAFNAQIEMLERDLAEAHAKVERAQAMAEKTRSGYVYIISNVGSFGGDVVKIGLTRRLDPADRIRELGDASVPFVFDTHAIIYSDNAPTLERALHTEFEPVRVNAQNYRKEFFKATLDQVEAAVKRLAPDAPFFKDVEAQDYRETLAKRRSLLLAEEASDVLLPEAI
ncbi:DUF4041 domain-containing protein [Rhizobium leguminosarum]|uniref:DUF4041 domain-containing protein n=1 Tax=Rhizobium leguminosarum TaxID=384 RepID=UPI0013BC7C81|nr:DUF4041 domain-containing protein [Rhizobium leguminosarum]MBY5385227.1 DUF4041 domain-containing protein [Rhizobium leguminosarum]NEH73985.1 DUF4041 domain-containing protein [Rhizobium leguminosarum]